jgi:hypothetical protein
MRVAREAGEGGAGGVMAQRVFIPGPLPGMNDIIAASKQRRGGWNGYHLLKQEWDAIIRYEIKRTGLKPLKSAKLLFTWQEPNKRRNPDNIAAGAKFCLDSLVRMKILPNDGWAEVQLIQHEFIVSKTAGVWVWLT